MIDRAVLSLVGRALEGERIPSVELRFLFDFAATSAEAAHVRWAAREITSRACGNKGQIYAQIGIDALPCGVDCAFCGMAASRHTGEIGGAGDTDGEKASRADAVLATEKVVEYARIFDEAGVHLISLMSTAALSFERLLDAVRAVRDAVSDDMPLLVNTRDFDLDEARLLKQAGVQAVYHANRLGEGTLTRADSAVRLATMRNATEAGMRLMNAVEPVHEGVSARDILDRMAQALSFEPYCSGVGTLTCVKGSPMEDARPISRARAAYLAAIMRMMAGDAVPFGTGGGNVMWVDAGTNPRGRDLPIDAAGLKRDVERVRKDLVGREWDVPVRPLSTWF